MVTGLNVGSARVFPSVRSLERYARPGPESVARHVALTDPAARRQPER